MCARVHAQTPPVSGQVFDANGTPLVGANVYWLNTTLGTATNQKGAFILDIPPSSLPAKLVASYVGLQNDTALVSGTSLPTNFYLEIANQIAAVEIVSNKNATATSMVNPIQTVQIDAIELTKAACCNLAESFETSNTVDVGAADAVSGAMKLQMLGLDGQYAYMLQENLPSLNGLGVNWGLGLIPGPWLASIAIAKGTGSVTQGYGGLTGTINTELLKPESAPKFYLNLYGDRMARLEANLHIKQPINDKVQGLWLVHGNIMNQFWDENHDHFADMPLSKQMNVLNRWQLKLPNNWRSQIGVNATFDNKRAGQIEPSHIGNNHVPFEITLNTQRIDAFAKIAKLYPNEPYRGLGFLAKGSFYNQSAAFGHRIYHGTQKSFYLNTVYQSVILNTNHQIKTGLSLQAEDFKEHFLIKSVQDTTMLRTEIVTGAYGEYTYTGKENWQIVGGVRLDAHNLFGLIPTLRLHAKYPITPYHVFRVAAGNGFRVANPIAENQAVLSSSRHVVWTQKLLPEKTQTYGMSYSWQGKLFERNITVDLDGYYTHFENQVIADLENPRLISFYNLQGVSYAWSTQIDVNINLIERLDLRVSYRNDDVKTTYNSQLLRKPFVANDKLLLNLAYATYYDKWKFDVTAQYFGTKRLPNTLSNPNDFQRPEQTPSFWLFNAQITKRYKKWEFYVGGENLFNFSQPNPIIDPTNPFGSFFDASLIWAPILGGRYYSGIRLTI